MPSKCTFNLNSKHELYYAGKDTIEGVVTLETTTVKNIKQIKLRFRGVTRCGFVDPVQGSENQDGVPQNFCYYMTKDNITKIENTVHPKGVLPAGTYTWPFSFPVNGECPTSMEGGGGHIRYELSLKIYNKDKYKNVFLKAISVVRTDDLNARPECKSAPETVVPARYCCGLFSHGARFSLRTVHGGYAPGQWLRYYLNIYEKNKQIEDYEIRFIKKIDYKGMKPGDGKFTEEITLHYAHHIDDGTKNQTIVHAFYVPSTPPTIKTKYISIRYYLRAEAKVRCCEPKVKAEIKVPIGTVPLMESLGPVLKQELVKLVEGSVNQYQINPTGYRRPEPCENPFVVRNTLDMNRIDNFLPLYPMYFLNDYQ